MSTCALETKITTTAAKIASIIPTPTTTETTEVSPRAVSNCGKTLLQDNFCQPSFIKSPVPMSKLFDLYKNSSWELLETNCWKELSKNRLLSLVI
eukprot:Awhi_evm1s12236